MTTILLICFISETIMFLHQIFYQGLKARIASWPTLVLGKRDGDNPSVTYTPICLSAHTIKILHKYRYCRFLRYLPNSKSLSRNIVLFPPIIHIVNGYNYFVLIYIFNI